MANYPIKLLKDESGTPFVPLTTVSALYMEENESLDDRLATKLETSNIKAGKDITLDINGNDITINNASIGVLIDNLDTETAGQGSLDAHQGKVLKELIPDVVNNLTTIDSTKALSAHQGYVLAGRSVPTGGTTGQVLMKSADDNYSLTWGDAADPNAIVGDGSVRKIVYLTMNEYNALETIDPDTEYHIQETSEDLSYISRDDIQEMISAAIAGEDTGWQDLTLNDGITADRARVRRKNGIVFLEIRNLKGWTLQNYFLTVPEGFRMSSGATYRFVVPSASTTWARVEYWANGGMAVYVTSGTEGAWIDVVLSYIPDGQ